MCVCVCVAGGMMRWWDRWFDFFFLDVKQILIPFASGGNRKAQILLSNGDFTVLDSFDHRSESYSLDSSMYFLL